jgi:hypothetical protein
LILVNAKPEPTQFFDWQCLVILAAGAQQIALPEKKKPTISQRWVLQIWLLDLGSNQGPTD